MYAGVSCWSIEEAYSVEIMVGSLWPPGLISVAMNPYGFPSYSDFVNMSAKKVKNEEKSEIEIIIKSCCWFYSL